PGEVDGEGRHLAAEVVHLEDEILRQVLRVAPDHPARAKRREAEFVARGRDRLDPRQAEVPYKVRRAERREERARRSIDVDVDVEALLGLKPVERVGQRLNGLEIA